MLEECSATLGDVPVFLGATGRTEATGVEPVVLEPGLGPSPPPPVMGLPQGMARRAQARLALISEYLLGDEDGEG